MGPFKVIRFQENNTVVILQNGKPRTINLDKIKPAYGFSDSANSNNENLIPDLVLPSHSPPRISAPPEIPQIKKKEKKRVTFTSFVRICDIDKPKHMPFRCVRMKT